MTKDQRRLVLQWVAAACVVVAFLAGAHYLTEERFHWLGLVILPFALVARVVAFQKGTTETGRANINEIADEHPWLKWWAVGCAAFFFGGAIYVLPQLQYHIEKENLMSFMIMAIAVVIGPLVFLIERERFREKGE